MDTPVETLEHVQVETDNTTKRFDFDYLGDLKPTMKRKLFCFFCDEEVPAKQVKREVKDVLKCDIDTVTLMNAEENEGKIFQVMDDLEIQLAKEIEEFMKKSIDEDTTDIAPACPDNQDNLEQQ